MKLSAIAFFLFPNEILKICNGLCTSSSCILKGNRIQSHFQNEIEGIVLQETSDSDQPSLLDSAFEALGDDEKYDAVLAGLCSRIIDGENYFDPDQIGYDATLSSSEVAIQRLKDPLRLLKEMNQRNVRASGRSLVGLIDAAATTQAPLAMASVLSLATKNGKVKHYGSLQSNIKPLPPNSNSFVLQTKMTRAARLEILVDVPIDNRTGEVTAALTTLSILGICVIIQGFGIANDVESFTIYTNILLYTILGVGILDNFFDVIKGVVSLFVTMNSELLPDAVTNIDGPKKEDLPLNLGTGAVTGTVVKGLTRLWSVDTQRECECEAASFFVAYSLGLPCFSMRPNALEAANLIFESNKSDYIGVPIDVLLTDAGLMKMLIWLLAPVAMESSLHPQLISSDPREARGMIHRLKEKACMFQADKIIESILMVDEGEGTNSQEIDDLLKWAYAEACLMVRENRPLVTRLTENLIGGASTIGDCVAVLEDW